LTNSNGKKPKRQSKPRQPITFEKCIGEPLSEDEHNEIADLIAAMIFDNLRAKAAAKPTQQAA
jgi:hypothetical protein